MKNIKKIIVLMSVYKPNTIWLSKQLESLNAQDYNNIELIVLDDCPEYPVNEDIFKKHIKNFNYCLIRGTKNLGYVKAFEKLTKIATERNVDVLAYCDQDDIWMNNKLSTCIKAFDDPDITLVSHNMSIIDEYDNIITPKSTTPPHNGVLETIFVNTLCFHVIQ